RRARAAAPRAPRRPDTQDALGDASARRRSTRGRPGAVATRHGRLRPRAGARRATAEGSPGTPQPLGALATDRRAERRRLARRAESRRADHRAAAGAARATV